MLTRMVIKNFKRFNEVEIELGNPVVFIGPNNSGKTSALQALALWEVGLKKWMEKRKGEKLPELRPGVTVNRRDLVSVPVPSANYLWRDVHVRDVTREGGKQKTKNIRIDITVEGITAGRKWTCGLEFDYANEESFYCRPLRLSEDSPSNRMSVPGESETVRIAFLPPMSGLAANETRLDRGAINVRVGEGRTAEVLRNLCYIICEQYPEEWSKLKDQILGLFGTELDEPRYVAVRGEIDLTYREKGTRLDLSSTGRGLQQTLLLLSYMYANPGAILLLDEPDAHLEILRQRQIYQLLTDIARQTDSQIIAASHSEVLLTEAAGRDVVVAFVGNPHRIDDRGSQVLKSLSKFGFEDYYQAEQTAWVLYLEGSTDLAILRAFARKIDHTRALKALERPFVRYVGNQPSVAKEHYWGMQEAVPYLKAIGIFDKQERPLPSELGPVFLMWVKREIENYFCSPETLLAYARCLGSTGRTAALGPLYEVPEIEKHQNAMQESIRELEEAFFKLHKLSPWHDDVKVSEEFLPRIFEIFFEKLQLPNIMQKNKFHILAEYIPTEKLDPEIREKLDAIVHVCQSAQPAE